ncbi:tyrosine-type recombinase/integrase [Geothrix campi]|uniref:tyrosine-type recombinase/integrase n=1 Tax=Geothrix campi TaxID=2966450 RepID=UPI0021492F20|nr:site-specific integrase [Geothrix sp. SG10]
MGYTKGLKLIGGKFHYRFKHNGQLLRGSTGCSTLPDAQRWLNRYRAKLAFEGIGIRDMPSLGQLLIEWMETASATNQPGQIASMKAALQRHCKHLLPLPIDQLTTERVQATLQLYVATNGRGPGRQGHTRGGANALRLRLNTLMGYAIRCGYLTKKPYQVKKFKVQQKPRPVVRTRQAKAFREALDRIGRSVDRKLAICMMLGLGLRESEALGMRWDLLDLRQGNLFVGRILDGEFYTKGGEARNLAIPGWLLERLLAHWKAAGKPKKGLVFPGPVNPDTKERDPHSPGYTAPLVRRIAQEIGLPGLTPHRMKASFVSALVLEGNIPLPQAQRMAGHKHVVTTMRYVEGAEEHKDAVDVLERLQRLGKGVPKRETKRRVKPPQRQQDRASSTE